MFDRGAQRRLLLRRTGHAVLFAEQNDVEVVQFASHNRKSTKILVFGQTKGELFDAVARRFHARDHFSALFLDAGKLLPEFVILDAQIATKRYNLGNLVFKCIKLVHHSDEYCFKYQAKSRDKQTILV